MARATDGQHAITRKVEDIQVLRAVAIIFVFFHHLSISPYLFQLLLPRAQKPFWVGVELFFVISGYVVTASILGRPLAPAGFLIRRAFRLLPAMVCFLAFSAAVCFSIWLLPTDDWGKEHIAGTLRSFMTDGIAILGGVLTIVGQSDRLTNGAMWSLSVEFQFYFAYALLIFLFLKASGAQFRSIVLGIAVALYAASLTARIAGPYAGNELPPLIKYFIFFKFDFLLLGVIGAAGLRPLIATRAIRYGLLVAPILIVISLILIACAEPFQLAYVFAPLLDGIVVPIVGILFLGLILLASVNRAFSGQDTPVYRFFVWIGELSYSIYLFHFPVFALYWLVVDLLHPAYFHSGDPGLLQMLVTVPLTVVIASFVYRRVEAPMNRLGAALANVGRSRSLAVSGSAPADALREERVRPV
jgi:peptidoglycan/LPS O-acetylase OafA/YrhL